MIPDRLDVAVLQQLLTTQTFGRPLYVLPQTTSTNDEVKALALRGAPEGTVVLAEQQTHGRGRQGRTFASPAGVGIYLSLLLRPTIDMARLPQLTLMVAVATADAMTAVCGVSIHLKWPNDVEIDGKKVAGILTEAVLRLGESASSNHWYWHQCEYHSRTVTICPPRPRNVLSACHWHACVTAPTHRLLAGAPWKTCTTHFKHAGMTSILERWRHYGRLSGRVVQFSQAAETENGACHRAR